MENLALLTGGMPTDLVDLPLTSEEPQQSAPAQVPADLQDLPNDFGSLFNQLHSEFQAQFKKPLRITTAPGSPGYRNLHKNLHNSNAADIGGSDLTDEEANWLTTRGSQYGLNVKDYRKNWKTIGGTAPHIHIDDDFSAVQTQSQTSNQSSASSEIPTDLIDLPLEPETPVLKSRSDIQTQAKKVKDLFNTINDQKTQLENAKGQIDPNDLEQQNNYNTAIDDYNKKLTEFQQLAQSHQVDLDIFNKNLSTKQAAASSAYKKLLPTLNAAAKDIGQFEALKEQAVQEKAASTGYLDNQWYDTLKIAQQKALEIQSRYGKHVEVGNLTDWPYVKPLGWEITKTGRPVAEFSAGIPKEQPEPTLEEFKHQVGDKQITGGLAASAHLPPDFDLSKAEKIAEEGDRYSATARYWQEKNLEEQKAIGQQKDIEHLKAGGLGIDNTLRHWASNLLAGLGETTWNVGVKVAELSPIGLLIEQVRPQSKDEVRHFLNEINRTAQNITQQNEGDKFFNNLLYQTGRLAPKMIAPGGIVGFAVTEGLDALGHGASPREVLKQSLLALGTAKLAHVFGISAAAIPSATLSHTLPNAIENFAKQWLAFSAAPAVVNFLTTAKTPDARQAAYDMAFGALFTLYGARIQDLDPSKPLPEFEPVLNEMRDQLVELGKMKPTDADEYIKTAYANAVIKSRNAGIDAVTVARNIRKGAADFWKNKLDWLGRYNKNAPKELGTTPDVEFESGLKEAIRQAKDQGIEITPEYLASKFGLPIEKADALIAEVSPIEETPTEAKSIQAEESTPSLEATVTPDIRTTLKNALYSDAEIAAMTPEQAQDAATRFEELYPTKKAQPELPGVVYRSDNGAALEVLEQVGEGYHVRNQNGKTYLIHQNATFIPEQVTSEGKGSVVFNKQTGQALTILGTRGTGYIVKNETGKIFTIHQNATIPVAPEVLSKEPPVPETSTTLASQMEALEAGRKAAVQITPGEKMPSIPTGFIATDTPVGTFIHPSSISPENIFQAVASNDWGHLIGIIAPRPAEHEPSITVVARDPKGHELQTAVVAPDKVDEQSDEFKKIYPSAEIVIGGERVTQSVLQDRVEGQRGLTEEETKAANKARVPEGMVVLGPEDLGITAEKGPLPANQKYGAKIEIPAEEMIEKGMPAFGAKSTSEDILSKEKPTPQEVGLDLRNKLREKHGTDLPVGDLVSDIPSFHVEMKKAGLNAHEQLEAFRTMGFNFKDPVQMIGTVRGTQSELGRIQRVDIKYKSGGQLLDYRVLGRFPGGEKILVMTPDSTIKIIQSPLGQTGNSRIKDEVSREVFGKVPSIKWQEIGMDGDAWPTKADIHRVNPAVDDVLDLTDDELQEHFPEVWRRVQEAQEQIGDAAGREYLARVYDEGNEDDNSQIQESRDRLRELFNANIRPTNTSQWLVDTAIVVGNDILKLHPEQGNWKSKVVEKLGEDIKPHLPEVWNAINGRAPMFFSPLERALKTELPNKAQADQIKGVIRKAGISDDEMKWTGFDEFLKNKGMKQEAITRQEAIEFFQQNKVSLNEKVFSDTVQMPPDLLWVQAMEVEAKRYGTEVGAWLAFKDGEIVYDDAGAARTLEEAQSDYRNILEESAQDKGKSTTRFTAHTLPGGTNHREITLALKDQVKPDTRRFELRNPYKLIRIRDLVPEDASDPTNLNYANNTGATVDDWVVIDETGEPVVDIPIEGTLSEQEALKDFVDMAEEAGADIVQEFTSTKSGNKGSYVVPSPHRYEVPEADTNRIAIVRVNDRVGSTGERILHVDELQDDLQNEIQGVKQTIKELEDSISKETNFSKKQLDKIELDSTRAELQRLQTLLPFRGKSHELAMKYALGYAINHGYDVMTWSTGTQVSDRYSLSKVIEGIAWTTKDGIHFNIAAVDKNNQTVIQMNNSTAREMIERGLNNSTVEKIINRHGRIVPYLKGSSTMDVGRLSNEDLKIPAPGKLHLYDKMLPDFMSKYTKKWNGEVGKTQIDTSTTATIPELKPFDEGTWSAYQGADKFDDGEPLFGETRVEIDGRKHQMFIIADRSGLSIMDREGESDFYLPAEWEKQEDARKFINTLWSNPNSSLWTMLENRVGIAESIKPALGTEDVHALSITSSMRSSILRSGQSLFGTSEGQPSEVTEALSRLKDTQARKRRNPSLGELLSIRQDEIAKARVGEGKIAAGYDPRLLEVMAQELYNKNIPQVTVKESIQNAMDSLTAAFPKGKAKAKDLAKTENELADIYNSIVDLLADIEPTKEEFQEIRDRLTRLSTGREQVLRKILPDRVFYALSYDKEASINDLGKQYVKVRDRNIPTFSIKVDEDNRTLTMEDNGIGMLPAVAEKEFVDPGGSYKPGQEETAGGYGIAKVAILGNAEILKVYTVALDPQTGKKIATSITGGEEYKDESGNFIPAARQWRDPELGLNSTSEEVDKDTLTGTSVTIKVRSDSENQQLKFDGWNIKEDVQNAIRYSTLPFNITYDDGYNNLSTSDTQTSPRTLLKSIDVPGAKADIYGADELSRSDYIDVHYLNHGLYQFSNQEYVQGGAGKAPSFITIDVKAKDKPGTGNYPWTPSREDLRRETKEQIDGFLKNLKNEITQAAAKRERQSYINAIHNAPIAKGSIGKDEATGLPKNAIVDTSNQISEELIGQIVNASYTKPLMDAYNDLFDTLALIMSNRDPNYLDTHFMGFGLGNDYLGVNIPHNLAFGSDGPNIILINPYNTLAEINGLVRGGDITPDEAKSMFTDYSFKTTIHEIAHRKYRSHGNEYGGPGHQGEVERFLAKLARKVPELTANMLKAVEGMNWNEFQEHAEEVLNAYRSGEDIFAKIGTHSTRDASERLREGLPEVGQEAGSRLGETLQRGSTDKTPTLAVSAEDRGRDSELESKNIVNDLRASSPEAARMITLAETGLGKSMASEAINRASRSGRTIRALGAAGNAVIDYRKNSNRLYVNHVGEELIKMIREDANGGTVSNAYGATFDIDKLKGLVEAATAMQKPLQNPEAIGVLDDLIKAFKSSIRNNEPLVIADYSALTGPGVRKTVKHEEVHRVDLMIRDAFNGIVPDANEMLQLPHMGQLTRRINGKMGYPVDPIIVAMEAIARISTGDNEELVLTPDEELEFMDGYYTLMADTYHEDVLDQYKLITDAARKVKDEVQARFKSPAQGTSDAAGTVSSMEGRREGRLEEEAGANTARQVDEAYDYLSGKISNGTLGNNPTLDSYNISLVTGYESLRDNPEMKRDEWESDIIRSLGERARPHLDAVWDLISGKAPTFYSPVRNLITAKVPNKASVEQIKGILKGISEDEMKWSGLDILLKEKAAAKESITKQELLDHLEVNNISVKTITSGATIKPLEWQDIEHINPEKPSRQEATDSVGYKYIIEPREIDEDTNRRNYSIIIKDPLGNQEIATFGGSLEAAHGLAESLRYDKKSPEEITKPDIDFLEQEGYDYQVDPDDTAETRVGFWKINEFREREGKDGWPLSSDELPLYLQEAALRIETAFSKRNGDTRYSEYKLEGGRNYTEIKLTLPVSKDRIALDSFIDLMKLKYNYKWTHAGIMTDEERTEHEQLMNQEIETYNSPHWDEDNVLAHIRGDEREHTDGIEGFVIDETQSDWIQQGRTRGFKSEKSFKIVAGNVRGFNIIDEHGRQYNSSPYPTELMAKESLERETKEKGIPDAPLIKQWPLLTVKQAIRHAVEQDLSRVSIVGARIHIDRWGTERAVWTPVFKILNHQTNRFMKEDFSSLQAAEYFISKEKETRIRLNQLPIGFSIGKNWRFQFKAQEGGQAGDINLEQEGLARGLISSGESVIVRDKEELLNEIKRNRASENAEAIADKLWSRMQKEDEGVSWPRAEGQLAHYGDTVDYIKSRFPNRPDLLKFAWDRGDGKQSEAFMPIAMRDVGKKWNANAKIRKIIDEDSTEKPNLVTDRTRPNGVRWEARKDRLPVYSLDISPSMSSAVIRTGQPLYGSSVDDPVYVLDAKQRMAPQNRKNIIDMGIVVGHDILSKEKTFYEEIMDKYPEAGETVDGRTVGEDIDNVNSISASLYHYNDVGIREIPMSEFDTETPTFYSKTERERTEQLAEEIKQSNRIDPLIVVTDKDGPYILEGGHRFDALKLLKANSFPALVVIDEDKRPTMDFKLWQDDMLRQLGESIRPHLDSIWSRLQEARAMENGIELQSIRYGKGDVFYSPLEEVIDEGMKNKMMPDQMKGWLRAQGITDDEMKWTGFDDYLKDKGMKQERITKDDALDFLLKNRVELVETKFEDISEEDKDRFITLERENRFNTLSDYDRPEYDKLKAKYKGQPKFSRAELNLPGGTNYKEMTLSLPTISITELPSNYEIVDAGPQLQYDEGYRYVVQDKELESARQIAFGHTPEEAEQNAISAINKGHLDLGDRYTVPTGHAYDIPQADVNRLAHVRFDDRIDTEGKKVLFLQEVQSDWHQAGRKSGYQESLDTTDWKAERDKDGYARDWKVFDKNGNWVRSVTADSEAEAIKKASDPSINSVPSAPFSKTWPELVLRRMLRYAAENNYDRIAWTTGEQQADRYDLSKQVDQLKVWKEPIDPDNNEPGGWYGVKAYKKGYSGTLLEAKAETAEKLAETIGKELAEKAVTDLKNDTEGRMASYEGVDLKVGGEGMKGFYDKILPSTANKIGKKWGTKSGEISIKTTATIENYDESLSEKNSLLEDYYDRQEEAEANGDMEELEEIGTEIANLEAEIKSLEDILFAHSQTQVHSLDIIPSMKDSVLKEGQPMFGSEPALLKKLRPLVKEGIELESRKSDKRDDKRLREVAKEVQAIFRNIPKSQQIKMTNWSAAFKAEDAMDALKAAGDILSKEDKGIELERKREDFDGKLIKQAIDHFGKVKDLSHAGYVLQDGSMLKYETHEAVGEILDPASWKKYTTPKDMDLDKKVEQSSDWINEFIDRTGAMRVTSWPKEKHLLLEVQHPVSEAQMRSVMTTMPDLKHFEFRVYTRNETQLFFDSEKNPSKLQISRLIREGNSVLSKEKGITLERKKPESDDETKARLSAIFDDLVPSTPESVTPKERGQDYYYIKLLEKEIAKQQAAGQVNPNLRKTYDAMKAEVKNTPVAVAGSGGNGQGGGKFYDAYMEDIPDPNRKHSAWDTIKASGLNKPWRSPLKAALEVVNFLRAFMTAPGIAPARHSLVLATTNPFSIGAKAFSKGLKASISSKVAFRAQMEQLANQPDFEFTKKIMGIEYTGPEVHRREELFRSNVAELLPHVRGSSQSFVGTLNWVRYLASSMMAKELREGVSWIPFVGQKLPIGRLKGVTPEEHPDVYFMAGRWINSASGRGYFGRFSQEEALMDILNTGLFSARLQKGRIDLLNPWTYRKLPLQARVLAMRKMFEFSSLIFLMLGLAAAAGFKVTMDIDDPDFGKIVRGNFHFDLTAGFASYIRLFAMSARDIKNGDRKHLEKIWGHFLWNKLAPLPAALVNIHFGQKSFGEPTDYKRELRDLATPIFAQSLIHGYKDSGVGGAILAGVPSLFHMGMEVYPPYTPTPNSKLGQKVAARRLDHLRSRYGDEPTSQDDKNKIETEKKIVEVLKAGSKPDGFISDEARSQAGELFNKAVSDGLLAPTDTKRIEKKATLNAQYDPSTAKIVYNIETMPFEEQLDMFLDSDASKEERTAMAPVIGERYMRWMKQRDDEAKEHKETVPKYVYDRILGKLEQAKKLGIVEMAQEKAKAASK
jgi:hypothetical protein